MDLDSNAYYKLCSPDCDDRYNEIIKAIHLLQYKHDNETPEMWCSRIRGPFRKILEKYFLRMDIFACMQSFMKMVKGFILAEI